MVYAVIFAGGTGKRMNTRAKPKQFLEVHGKPVLIYTMEKFQDNKDVDKIVLVCLDTWINYAKKLIQEYRLYKVCAVVSGGASGQDSIFHGLQAVWGLSKQRDDIVLIHDGVRPLIDDETITACIASVKKNGNAITTTPAIETIFTNSKDGCVGEIFNRSQCLMARAPQCFYLNDIYHAHKQAQKDNRLDFIDSAMLMQHYGAKLYTVPGPVENIKITTPTDFYLFRALLDARENMQIVGV